MEKPETMDMADPQHVPQVAMTPESEEAALAELFSIPDGPAPAYTAADASSILAKPLALPRTSTSYDSPFARAWAPDLEQLGITQDKWLDFIDGLSLAMVGSPPLSVLNTVGSIVGLVPFWPALVAGIGTQVAAQTGQHILSKTMTDKYLARANKEFFGVRGLRVRLMKGNAVKVFTGHTKQAEQQTKMARIGGGTEKFLTKVRLPIVTPIAAAILDAVKPVSEQTPSSAPPASQLNTNGPCDAFVQRRIATVQPYIAPITFDVPPRRTPEGLMNKWSASAVASNMNKSQRKRQKDERRRSRIMTIDSNDPQNGPLVQDPRSNLEYASLDKRARKDARRDAKDARRQQRRIDKGKDPVSRPKRRQGHMAQRRENFVEDDLVWLVVYPAARDAEIQGVERLDSMTPVELSESDYERLQAECEAEEEEEEDSESSSGSDKPSPPAYRP